MYRYYVQMIPAKLEVHSTVAWRQTIDKDRGKPVFTDHCHERPPVLTDHTFCGQRGSLPRQVLLSRLVKDNKSFKGGWVRSNHGNLRALLNEKQHKGLINIYIHVQMHVLMRNCLTSIDIQYLTDSWIKPIHRNRFVAETQMTFHVQWYMGRINDYARFSDTVVPFLKDTL